MRLHIQKIDTLLIFPSNVIAAKGLLFSRILGLGLTFIIPMLIKLNIIIIKTKSN